MKNRPIRMEDSILLVLNECKNALTTQSIADTLNKQGNKISLASVSFEVSRLFSKGWLLRNKAEKGSYVRSRPYLYRLSEKGREHYQAQKISRDIMAELSRLTPPIVHKKPKPLRYTL